MKQGIAPTLVIMPMKLTHFCRFSGLLTRGVCHCITLDKGVGKATLDGAKMSDDVVYGDGETSIEIDGGVGAMKIEFAA